MAVSSFEWKKEKHAPAANPFQLRPMTAHWGEADLIWSADKQPLLTLNRHSSN